MKSERDIKTKVDELLLVQNVNELEAQLAEWLESLSPADAEIVCGILSRGIGVNLPATAVLSAFTRHFYFE